MKDVYAGYFTIAEEYFKMEKYAKAAEFYEKCLKDNDELTLRNVKYKLAQSYLKLTKWKDASKIYEELLEVDSDNTNLKTLLAYSYMKNGVFDEAIVNADPNMFFVTYKGLFTEDDYQIIKRWKDAVESNQ